MTKQSKNLIIARERRYRLAMTVIINTDEATRL